MQGYAAPPCSHSTAISWSRGICVVLQHWRCACEMTSTELSMSHAVTVTDGIVAMVYVHGMAPCGVSRQTVCSVHFTMSTPPGYLRCCLPANATATRHTPQDTCGQNLLLRSIKCRAVARTSCDDKHTACCFSFTLGHRNCNKAQSCPCPQDMHFDGPSADLVGPVTMTVKPCRSWPPISWRVGT